MGVWSPGAVQGHAAVVELLVWYIGASMLDIEFWFGIECVAGAARQQSLPPLPAVSRVVQYDGHRTKPFVHFGAGV